MFSRLKFILSGFAAAVLTNETALAHWVTVGGQSKLSKQYQPLSVAFSGCKPDATVIATRSHYRHRVPPRRKARRFCIAVGRVGLAFIGIAKILRF